MDDSKELWLSVHKRIARRPFTLGVASSNAMFSDPKMLGFMAARYKFVSKMLAGMQTAAEIGCGDGFGAPIVARAVTSLLCTDIDEATLDDNRGRLAEFPNIEFRYHDFRSAPLAERVDAAYAVDVIEHIFEHEENAFLANIARSLTATGVLIVGTPNVEAERYASELSRQGHVNLKSQESLRKTMSAHFHNVFMFGMNDEIVHTGFGPMAHYVWALCVSPRAQTA
jgi:cyclopropane fatty-acyl-phospholipid synthase-like methyltransferase